MIGEFILSMPLTDPQRIVVKAFGSGYLVALRDRFDRSRFFVGREVGFGVTEFKPRGHGEACLVVFGKWQNAFFVDPSGRKFDCEINDASQKEV